MQRPEVDWEYWRNEIIKSLRAISDDERIIIDAANELISLAMKHSARLDQSCLTQ